MTDRRIDVAAWLPAGEWARADPVRRSLWLRGVAADLRDDKVRQIESGIGADGRPMPRVKPTSRPDGTTDRPLIPHDDLSRTIRLLKVTANNRTGVVTFHWNAWTTILDHHARGKKPLPRRDVYGTPGRFTRRTKTKARADWRRTFPFLDRTIRLEAALVARGPARPTPVAAPPRPLADRSVVARKRFGPSRAKIEVAADADYPAAMAEARAILGRKVTERDLATLAGAPDDATVTILPRAKGAGVMLRVDHPDLVAKRLLTRGPDGPVISNESLYVNHDAHGQGHGTRMLGRQVEHARKLGIDRIETYAERDAHSVGYKVWPKLGYDGPIPDRVRPTLPVDLAKARDVSDLMATPEGRAWWEEHGVGVDLTFDVRRDSDSSRMLDAYLIRRGFP